MFSPHHIFRYIPELPSRQHDLRHCVVAQNSHRSPSDVHLTATTHVYSMALECCHSILFFSYDSKGRIREITRLIDITLLWRLPLYAASILPTGPPCSAMALRRKSIHNSKAWKGVAFILHPLNRNYLSYMLEELRRDALRFENVDSLESYPIRNMPLKYKDWQQ
jgi:hypothetical protein